MMNIEKSLVTSNQPKKSLPNGAHVFQMSIMQCFDKTHLKAALSVLKNPLKTIKLFHFLLSNTEMGSMSSHNLQYRL